MSDDAGARSILLVDDRAENLLALEAILEPLGHRLVSVTSGDGGAEGAAARRLRAASCSTCRCRSSTASRSRR